MVTGPPVSSTTMVRGLAAATAATSSSWLCGSARLRASVPSQASCVASIIFTPTAGDVRWTNLAITDNSGNTASALLQGTGEDFILNNNTFSTTMTINAGQTANITVWLAAQGGFTGTINLSCKGGPQGGTCTTAPSSFTPTLANPATAVTVSVSTPHTAAAGALAFDLPEAEVSPVLKPGLTFLIVVLLAPLLFRRRLSDKALISTAGLSLVLAIFTFCISCGGGSSNTNSSPNGNPAPSPPQPTTYIITVTGTSGSLANTMILTLIVNP